MSIDTINKRLKIISDLQTELNKVKALLEEKLEDDPNYQRLQEEQTRAKQEIKEKKDKVLTTETIKALDDEIKKLRDDVKENKEMLAVELADYYRESGSMEIVDDEGNTLRIVFSAKLVNS